ncbi:hypothetical protein GCM10027280_22480 [Micromonospora polyrhachis]
MTLEMFSPPVVSCDHCEGQGRKLVLCQCVRWGNRFLVDATSDRHSADGRAYQDCELCKGSGYVGHDCDQCRRTGRRRAQLVLTVANLDTGAVRSLNVVPGGVEPRRNAGGRWELALSPVVAALAAEVGAGEWWDAFPPGGSADPLPILLPTDWQPTLPAADRWQLEAAAITRHCWHPWRLWFARTEPSPERNLDAELGWLCHLADLWCLDLVVEVRRRGQGLRVRKPNGRGLNWDIRYELPGGGVPSRQRSWAEDLPAAVAATTAQDAMFNLVERSLTAPPHFLRPHRPHRSGPPVIDVDQVERRVYADLEGVGGAAHGAQAIWRDGRWQHTRLQVEDQVEVLTEQSTGQVVRETKIVLSRTWEPPAPAWHGDPIPYDPCPACDPQHRLRICLCTLGNRPPDPACPGCDGAGVAAETGACHACRDSGRVYRGMVVTLTDLADTTLHLNWLPPERSVDAPQADVDLNNAPQADVDLNDAPQVDVDLNDAPQADVDLNDAPQADVDLNDAPQADVDLNDAPQVATQPGGKPVRQLPAQYQLGHWARVLDARPADLTYLDGDHRVEQDLLDGTVTVDHLGVDPYARYIADASGQHPAGRLLIDISPPAAVRITKLIRLALGLHQTLVVTLTDHRLNEHDPRLIHGESWNIAMIPPGQPLDPALQPYQSSPEAASAYFLEYLENALADAVPADPRQGIRVPQTPEPAPLVEDLVPLIRRLAHHHAGQPVSIRYHHTGCHLYVHEHRDSLRHLVSARTVPIALAAIGLAPG